MTQDESDYRTKFDREYNMVNLSNQLGPDWRIQIGFSFFIAAPPDEPDEIGTDDPFFLDEHGNWMIAVLNENTRQWNALRCDMVTDRWTNKYAYTTETMLKLYKP